MAPRDAEDGSKRLHIISANEVAAIYDLPGFTAEDQAHFFSLSAHERALLPQLHTYTSRIFFILQLGYFKAVRQFFVFKLGEVVQDITWIQQTHFPDRKLPGAEEVARELGKARSIDDFYGKDGIFARLFSETIEQMLEAELTDELGYERYEAAGRNSGNSRNGHYPSSMRTSGVMPKSKYRGIAMGSFNPSC